MRPCTGCGEALDEAGYCVTFGGYAGNLPNPPVVCPQCRGPLTWAGACYVCRLFPGDEWRWDRGHYVLEREGPGRRATPEEAVSAVKAIGLRLEAAEADGKLKVVGANTFPVGALIFHGVAPGLRVGEKPKTESPQSPESTP